MRIRTHLLALGLVLFCSAAAQAQTTALYIHSQAGDYIGNGQIATFTPADFAFSSSTYTSSVTISTAYVNSQRWYLNFQAPSGLAMQPGTYERAVSGYSKPWGLPGLEVDGYGRSCSTVVGRFVVYEVVFTGSTLTSFAADFEQHCNYASPALFGAIRYNSSRSTLVPFDGNYPTYKLRINAATNGYVTGTGIDCGAGHTDCDETYTSVTNVTLTPVPSAGYAFLGWSGECAGEATAAVPVDRRVECTPVFNSVAGAGPELPNYSARSIFLDDPATSYSPHRLTVFLQADSDISVYAYSVNDDVSFDVRGPRGESWSGRFEPAPGSILTVGDYPLTGSSGNLPYLYTSCGSGGRFRIHEITHTTTTSGSTLATFAADFEQPCRGSVLRGAIRYNSARPSLLPFNGESVINRLAVGASVGGRVTGPDINCGSGNTDCTVVLASSATLTLQAVPEPGYEFVSWSFDCSSGAASTSVLVNRSRRCFAYFQPASAASTTPDASFATRAMFRYQPGATAASQRRMWTATDSVFTASADYSYPRSLSVSAASESGSGSVSFGAPLGSTLAPGYYDEAYPSANAAYPTLNLSGSDSCAATRGRFLVYELRFSSTGRVLAFAADYQVQCSSGGPVYGAVRYNSTRATIRPFDGALDSYTLSIAPSPRGTVTGQGIDCGPNGHNDCSETYAGAPSITLTATPIGGNVFLGWRGACDGGSVTTVRVLWPVRCAPVFFMPTGTAATEDPELSAASFFIDSEAGDPVGLGRRHVWTSDALIGPSSSISRNSVGITVTEPNGSRWNLTFRAPGAANLVRGVYENATYPSATSGVPGLQVTSANSNCSSPRGRFVIHEVSFESDGYYIYLQSFAADFEQTCGTASGMLRGSVRFNSSRPNLIPFGGGSISLTQGIVLGLGAYTDGGWIATRGGAASSFAPAAWVRLPWATYNNSGKGVRVALGDVDGDGLDEMVVGLESGGDGWMAVIDDTMHGSALMQWLHVPWVTYNSANGEVWPAVGDIDGDGRAEIVAGLGAGGGGWFAIFDDAAAGFAFRAWRQVAWPAYNGANGSTRPAIANVDGTGPAEIVIGLGPGGDGRIEVFSGSGGSYWHQAWLQVPWSAYNSANGETFVAAGDLDADGKAEVVAGLGTGGGGYAHVFDDATTGYASLTWRRTSWAAYNNDALRGAVHPAVGDVDGDGKADIVLGLGEYPGSGGWFEIIAANGTSLGWKNVGWAAFTAAGGAVFPAIGIR